MLGRVMPPWARDAVDVLGELDDTGRYVYDVGVILVPRQSAKTTTALDVALGRGLVHRDYRAAYAAQTGHVTTERMGDRFTEVSLSPLLEPRCRLRRSAGTERLTLRAHGSYVKAFPPLDGALRSSALDLVIIDEGQEHDDEPLGKALDATIMPTFTTRPRRQFLILGTAPDRPGTYLERYANLARAGAPGVALVDYGAGVDEDPADPATWHRRHPGLAAGLTDVEYLQAQHDRNPDLFAREHLNVWPKGRAGAAIPSEAWEAASRPQTPPRAGAAWFAVDVAPGGVAAAVAAAWVDEDGRAHGTVVQAAPGTSWLDAAVPDLQRRHAPAGWTWDRISPADGIMRRLLRGVDGALDFGDVAAGCSWFLEAIIDGRLEVGPDPDLDDAAAVAVRRMVGDSGRWAWGRRHGAGPVPVAPLVAVTLAVYRAVNPPAAPFLL
jgi:hypothetical protein